MQKLLIIDDSDEIRNQLKWGLAKDYEVVLAKDRSEALIQFRKHMPPVVTLDLGLPPHENGPEEGFQCLEQILQAAPATKVIMITGQDGRENALRAIQTGAYDFYQKPIDLNELRVTINRAFNLASLEEENRRLQRRIEISSSELGGMVGDCEEMSKVFATIRKVAPSDVPVLIIGESGTGKELVAQAIHRLSMRKDGTFVPINCGAIPENLLEAELFGFEKGAFTGAYSRVQGKVEYANRGTLFLDEIGELPGTLQVKLLRFLQEKVIQRVGGREDINVDSRIIAATNIDILKAIQQGTFREDLYYRIGVITIKLPALRERRGDILLLANLFLRRACEELRKKIKGFSPDAVNILQNYEWPGNVRELENKIQRAVIMSDSAMIEPDDLGFVSTPSETSGISLNGKLTLKQARERLEREMIQQTIQINAGNIAKAADELGISRPTLYDLIRKHNITTVA